MLLAALLSGAILLVTAGGASARGLGVKIVSPRAGQTVSGKLQVQARVTPARAPSKVLFYVDGKLAATRRGGRAARASRSVRIDTGRLAHGRHKIRVVVSSRHRRATSSVSVQVADSSSAKSASTANGGDTGSDEPMPTGNADGFRLEFSDDFTKSAALGSFASDCDADKIVYTGATGTQWRAYPSCYTDTYQHRPYRSDQVLSVQNGELDFWLHNVDGQPAGANPSPVLPNGSQYQTFGRYSARVKIDGGDLSEYYMAWLLWPQDESGWASAESDFPEGALNPGQNGVAGFHHYGAGGKQEAFGDSSIDMHQWHTYTQDWTPTARHYYVDGKLIYTTINPVWQSPERWQLQTETNGFGNNSGHLLVDWVAVYAYAPGTPAS